MWFRRKKANPPMEDLINLIDSVLVAAGGSCTQCLIDELGNDSSEIGDAIVGLNTAYLMRSIAPNGEDNLTLAFARFLRMVTQMATTRLVQILPSSSVSWNKPNRPEPPPPRNQSSVNPRQGGAG